VGYRQTLSPNRPRRLGVHGDNWRYHRNLRHALARCGVVGVKVRYLGRLVFAVPIPIEFTHLQNLHNLLRVPFHYTTFQILCNLKPAPGKIFKVPKAKFVV
jgi:hypothetical protein